MGLEYGLGQIFQEMEKAVMGGFIVETPVFNQTIFQKCD